MMPSLNTEKLALIYPRQSTAHQLENNVYSLENQLKLRDRAIADGFPEELVMVIDDDLGKSARTIAMRVGMSRALKMVEQGMVGALYAEDQTRLSRDIDTVDHMEIAKRCRLAGVPMYYGGSWRDMTDRGTRIAYKVEAVINSEMWGGHLEKMHTNQRMKAERGQVATSTVRWGYRVNRDVPRRHPDRDKLIVHEAEAAIIRGLVAQLEAAGSVRELYRRTFPIYWPDGTKLTYRTFSAILRSPTYRGIYTWGDVRVEGAHEAIIGPTEAAMIDDMASRNKAIKRGAAADDSGGALCGLVWCLDCDRRMYNSRSNRKADYRCTIKDIEKPTVFHFGIAAPRLDEIVIADLFRRLGNGMIERLIEQLEGEKEAQQLVVHNSEASRLGLQRKVDGLTRSLSDPDVSDVVRKVLLTQLDQVAREMDALDRQKPFNPHLDVNIDYYRRLRADIDFLAALPASWDDEPIDWRRSWVRRFIERVEMRCRTRGRFDVFVRYRDGEVSEHTITTKPGVTQEELELVRRLLQDPERPRRYCMDWFQAEMAKHGFERTKAGVSRTVAIAMGKKHK